MGKHTIISRMTKAERDLLGATAAATGTLLSMMAAGDVRPSMDFARTVLPGFAALMKAFEDETPPAPPKLLVPGQ